MASLKSHRWVPSFCPQSVDSEMIPANGTSRTNASPFRSPFQPTHVPKRGGEKKEAPPGNKKKKEKKHRPNKTERVECAFGSQNEGRRAWSPARRAPSPGHSSALEAAPRSARLRRGSLEVFGSARGWGPGWGFVGGNGSVQGFGGGKGRCQGSRNLGEMARLEKVGGGRGGGTAGNRAVKRGTGGPGP